MSSEEFERIQPAAVDIPLAPTPSPGTTPHRSLAVPALVVATLLLLAGAVFFLLPDYVARQHSATAEAAGSAETARAGSAASDGPTAAPGDAGIRIQAPETPHAAAVEARERSAAKEALDALLMVQHDLQERGASRWAKSELEQATALAAKGDLAYRKGDYGAAQARYREATAILQATLDGAAARLQDRITRGSAALVAGNAAEAGTLFDEALAIEPGNTAAQHGLRRAGTLAQVLELSARAVTANAAGDLALAQKTYEEALALDGEHEPARRGLDDLQARINEQGYRKRLSAGFAALAAGDNPAAVSEFRTALALRKNSTEARDGLQQAEFQLSQQRISRLLASAQRAAGTERWTEAKRDFDAALAIDATLGPALEGSRKATQRLTLDEALSGLEHNPDRLLEPSTRSRASELIAHAAAIADPGPRLQAQLVTTRRLLTAYGTPLALRLRSDGQTEVSVLRMGSYGTLTEKTLELLPGDYVAVGRRDGYRDVRIEFRVRVGQIPGDVLVQCVEKV